MSFAFIAASFSSTLLPPPLSANHPPAASSGSATSAPIRTFFFPPPATRVSAIVLAGIAEFRRLFARRSAAPSLSVSALAKSIADRKRSAGTFAIARTIASSTASGHGAAHDLEARHVVERVPREQRHRRRPGERRLAGEHLVHHARQAVDVALGRDVLAAHRLLGAHVRRRADGHARACQPLPSSHAHRARDAEIGHERATVGEQDVLRLDVAMDDALRVRVRQRLGDLLRQVERFVDRQLLLAIELVAQRRAFDEGHRVVQLPVRRARVEHAHDVRVLERAADLDLAQEAFGAERGGELRVQHLDRDVAVVAPGRTPGTRWPSHPVPALARGGTSPRAHCERPSGSPKRSTSGSCRTAEKSRFARKARPRRATPEACDLEYI